MTAMTVTYDFHRMSEEGVEVELTVIPEIYVVVGDSAYFSDSDGFLMMCPVYDMMSAKSDLTTFAAVNAKWWDEGDYGHDVPNEVSDGSARVCAALTAMHGMASFNR